jgi:hypothetical protein
VIGILPFLNQLASTLGASSQQCVTLLLTAAILAASLAFIVSFWSGEI